MQAVQRRKASWASRREVVIFESSVGFGFTLGNQYPSKITSVTHRGPADLVGLNAGDYVMSIDGENVAQLSHDEIIKRVGISKVKGSIRLEVVQSHASLRSSEEEVDYRKSSYQNMSRSKSSLSQCMGRTGYESRTSCVPSFGKLKHDPRLSRGPPLEHDLHSSGWKTQSSLYSSVNQTSKARAQDKYHSHRHKDASGFTAKQFRDSLNYAFTGLFSEEEMENVNPRLNKPIQSTKYLTPRKPTNHTVIKRVSTKAGILKGSSSRLSHSDRYLEADWNDYDEQFSDNDNELEDFNSCRSFDEFQVIINYVGAVDMPKDSTRLKTQSELMQTAMQRLRSSSQRGQGMVLMDVDLDGIRLSDAVGVVIVHYSINCLSSWELCKDDERYFALLMAQPDPVEPGRISGSSCHVFKVESDMVDHQVHTVIINRFAMNCTMNLDTNLCNEFPPTAKVIVAFINKMFDHLNVSDQSEESNQSEIEHLRPCQGRGQNTGSSSIKAVVVEMNSKDPQPDSTFHADESEASQISSTEARVRTDDSSDETNTHKEALFVEVESSRLVPSHATISHLSLRAMPDPVAYELQPKNVKQRSTSHYFQAPQINSNGEVSNYDTFVSPAPVIPPKGLPKILNSDVVSSPVPLVPPKYLPKKPNSEAINSPVPIVPPKNLHKKSNCDTSATVSTSGTFKPKLVTPTNSDKKSANNHRKLPSVSFASSSKPPLPGKLLPGAPSNRPLPERPKSTPPVKGCKEIMPDYPDDAFDSDPGETGHLEKINNTTELRVCSTISDDVGAIPVGTDTNLQDQLDSLIPNNNIDSPVIATPTKTLKNSDSKLFGIVGSHECISSYNMQNNRSGSPSSFAVGRAASWAVSFDHLLSDKAGIATFTQFLTKEFCQENIVFWLKVEEYRKATDSERKVLGPKIFKDHLATDANDPINVDGISRREVKEKLELFEPDLFQCCQSHIKGLMRTDKYSRFRRSDLYKDAVLAELEGKPFPFSGEPACEDPKDKQQLKKTKSDRGEEGKKRRSILFWNRKKNSAKGSLDLNQIHAASTSDIVHSVDSTSSIDSNRFCQVTLANQNVVQLRTTTNQKICEVLVKLGDNIQPGLVFMEVIDSLTSQVIDVSKNISSLALKEIHLERCAVFRLDLPNSKTMAVRSRPNKTIGQTLGPILSKYQMELKKMIVHVVGTGIILNDDVLIETLDCKQVTAEHLDAYKGKRKRGSVMHAPEGSTANKKSHLRQKSNQSDIVSSSQPFQLPSVQALQDLFVGVFDSPVDFNSLVFNDLGFCTTDKMVSEKKSRSDENRGLAIFNFMRRSSLDKRLKFPPLSPRLRQSLPGPGLPQPFAGKENDEKIFDMLLKAQGRTLENQRGQCSSADFRIPAFLLDSTDEDKSSRTSDSDSSPKPAESCESLFRTPENPIVVDDSLHQSSETADSSTDSHGVSPTLV